MKLKSCMRSSRGVRGRCTVKLCCDFHGGSSLCGRMKRSVVPGEDLEVSYTYTFTGKPVMIDLIKSQAYQAAILYAHHFYHHTMILLNA